MRNHISRYKGNQFADCNLVMLPQNLLINPGTLYEDFETAGDWTAASGTCAANTSQFKTGTQSMKLSTNSGATATMTKTVNLDLSGDWQSLDIWLYIHNSTFTDYGGSILLYLGNNSGLTNALRAWIGTNQILTTGWHCLHIGKSDFNVVSAGTFASPIIRVQVRVQGATGKVAEVSFDSLYIGINRIPAVWLRYDDGYSSQYTCFQYMKPLGIRASVSVQTNLSNISAAQYQEMDAAGWCMANHTNATTDLTTLTEAQQETQILGGYNALVAAGLPKGAKYLVYPSGNSNIDTDIAMANLGMLNGQGAGTNTTAQGFRMIALPYAPTSKIIGIAITSSTSVATFKGYIDLAINCGYIMQLYFHDVGNTGQMTQANHNLCMDYIYTKWKSGLIYPITADDFYKLSLGPVKVPKVNW
jgi:hypothetical protein